ncbi:hypothetical protein KKF61_07470 [Patescibacteria group bacterium]|nr:hypothetical protein [Patescibacteria group bacterium]
MSSVKSDIKIKPQSEFPYLDDYKKVFPTTDDTIFVFYDTIYTNKDLTDYYDVLAHELKHLQRQGKIGAAKWIKQYIENSKFRLEEELIAYRHQLKVVKQTGDRQELSHIYIECCQNISSDLYGNMITYPEALKKLKP